jgi:hypothetical protein
MNAFTIGQQVCDLDGERPGVVVKIGQYDSYGDFTRIRVAEFNGPTHWRNSNNLKELPCQTIQLTTHQSILKD